MDNFQQMAQKLGLSLVKKFPNYSPSLHPKWQEAMFKYGVDIDSLGSDNEDALASIANTEDFSFYHVDINKSTSKALLVMAPAELALQVQELFAKPYQLVEQPTLNLAYCHAVAQWKTPEDFVFEMNAQLILEIANSEQDNLKKKGSVHIPIIIFCGKCVYIYGMELNQAMHAQLAQMVEEVSTKWSPGNISEERQSRLLANFEVAVDEGMYPPYGFMIGDYLRVWTPYDAHAY